MSPAILPDIADVAPGLAALGRGLKLFTDPIRAGVIQYARGRHLSRLGLVLGFRRRWFGLEPDRLFRRRLLRHLLASGAPSRLVSAPASPLRRLLVKLHRSWGR